MSTTVPAIKSNTTSGKKSTTEPSKKSLKSQDKKIKYKEPKPLSWPDAQKYYDKIKIFKHFKASMSVIYFDDPAITIHHDLGKYKNMNKKEYEEYIKTEEYKLEKDFECYYVGKKGALSKDYGYVYGFNKESDDNLDEIDKKFVETKTADKKIELYGLHEYGGYYGFFRPDFYEAIGLLSDKLSIDELEEVDRMYITTEPHPSGDIGECFDSAKDKHRGKTTCYIFYHDFNERSNKRLKTTD